MCAECTGLAFRGEYQVNMSSAYNYLSGQYINFEDILLEEDDGQLFEDGMCFVTARYLIKDRNMILKRLEDLCSLQVEVHGEFQVFYQQEEYADDHGFLAEYVLGDNWITVSAFGDKDLGLVRQHFEKDMYDGLEFDGLEIREEGIFAILTMGIKRQYPQLEPILKEMYLNKWYHSHLSTLSGMSPLEAIQTEEGTRLLWTMFKRIKQKEKVRHLQGESKQIGLKEYIRRVDFKKEGKH